MTTESDQDGPTVLVTGPSTATAGVPAPQGADEDTNGLRIGMRLGEFEITKRLGEGGFSIVYLAWDHSLDRKIALKEYMPSSIATRLGNTQVTPRSDRHRYTFDAGLKSFINEGKLLAQFDHPSLVKVYRFWEANGTAYMVMPLYEGVTVKDAVQSLSQRPDEAWLLGLLGPLIEALSVIHAENCYHRDIAPDNVMLLAGSGKPLLLDFGAARRVIGDLTQALTVILKPGYAPIEQYAEVPGMKQGPWTDVYALGAVVHWIISGKTPPPSVGRMISDSYVPLAESAAGKYSEPFLQAIDRALAVMPERRTQTIEALRRELGIRRDASAPAAPPPHWDDPDATVIRAPHTGAGSSRADEPLISTVVETSAPPAPAPSPSASASASPEALETKKRSSLPLIGVGVIATSLVIGGMWWVSRERVERPIPERPSFPAATRPAVVKEVRPPVTIPEPPATSRVGEAGPASEPAGLPREAPVDVVQPASVDRIPAVNVSSPPGVRIPTKLPSKPPHKDERSNQVAKPTNAPECATILARQSMGESSPDLADRYRSLGCR